jgi:ribonuclease BN (tRNA processing enzyme)
MKLRVLGSAGAEFPNFHPPAFLVDEILLLDAGTIGAVLSEDEQWGLGYILITHTHLDHIKGIPLLADNIIIKQIKHTVKVISIRENLEALHNHMLNNIIWPDFTTLPTEDAPVIKLVEIGTNKEHLINGYSITACEVNHSVPAVGYIIRKDGKGVLYTGDTGPTEAIWRYAADLSAIIVEVSFPNAMEEMALLTGHLTASLLAKELDKIATLPPRILITHPKPQYFELIARELSALGIPQIELLKDGASYEL